jgi:hypothetical protein
VILNRSVIEPINAHSEIDDADVEEWRTSCSKVNCSGRRGAERYIVVMNDSTTLITGSLLVVRRDLDVLEWGKHLGVNAQLADTTLAVTELRIPELDKQSSKSDSVQSFLKDGMLSLY